MTKASIRPQTISATTCAIPEPDMAPSIETHAAPQPSLQTSAPSPKFGLSLPRNRRNHRQNRQLPHQSINHAKRQERCLTYLCGEGYSHGVPNLSAHRRRAIRDGRAWPSYRELLTVQEFYRGNFFADISQFSRILLKYEAFTFRDLNISARKGGPNRILKPLAREAFCCLSYLSVAYNPEMLQRLAAAVQKWNHHAPTDRWTIFSEREVFGRIEVYLACAWDKQAQANVARACLREAVRQKDAAASTLAFAAALGWLNYSGKETTRANRGNAPLYPALIATDGDLTLMRLRPHLSDKNFYNLLVGKDIFEDSEPPSTLPSWK